MRPLSRRGTSVGTLNAVRAPADVRPSLLWYHREHEGGGFSSEAFSNPDWHGKPHHIYWGSHGCARPAGHDGPCWCDCCECEDHPEPGCVAGPPYYGPSHVTNFYGEDVPGGWHEGTSTRFEVLP